MSETQADTLEVLLKAEWFERVLEISNTTALECILRFGSDGVQTRVVDPANIYMTDLSLDAGAFESVGDGSFPAGINIERFRNVIARAEDDDVVSLAYDQESRKLRVRYGGRVDNTMALIDPDSIRNEPDLPDLDLPNQITVEAGQFRAGLENADLVSDHVWLRNTAERDGDETDRLRIEAEGDTDDARYKLTAEDMIERRNERQRKLQELTE